MTFSIGQNVIDIEIKALNLLKKSIRKNQFEIAVNYLYKTSGKIIISGIGKSAIIGKKISSTFASVGIPSFFVDAASCSHGDLGQISSNDVLILISFSGESV